MSTLKIENVRAVLSDRVTPPTSVIITDNIITEIGAENTPADVVINAEEGYLFPGFIDLHVHGGGGADFMDATVEAFEKAVKTHVKTGTTTLVPTAMTATNEELCAFITAYKQFKEKSPYAQYTAGLHLEGPYLSGADKKSAGAQSGDLIRPIDFDEVNRLLTLAEGNIIRWDAAPENENSAEFARLLKENNILCAAAHSNATGYEAEAGFNGGFSHVTHFYNAVTAYKKRDQVVTAGVVEAAYLNDDVTVELICDGKHIPEHCMKLALKIKGADKVMGITDATALAGTNEVEGILGSKANGIRVIVEDGVAKLPDRSSFAGSICTMERALKVVCTTYGIDPVTAAKMLSTTPAKHIKAEKIGEIKKGYIADLVITDSEFTVKTTIKNGKTV